MVQGLNAESAAQLNAGLARVRERFVSSLSDRVDDFYDLLGDLQEEQDWLDACADLRARAHKLHGICGSVGFPEIGEKAASLEAKIDSLGSELQREDIDDVRCFLNSLLDEMEQNLDAA
ncbi:MAG: Hpt domain-containing protein [Antarcticimicrobium sp.]|nr:Hpt domain-containing protein [Antarcticimicrobium sp.]